MKFKTVLQLVFITLSLLPLAIAGLLFENQIATKSAQEPVSLTYMMLIGAFALGMSILVSFFVSKPLERLVIKAESIQGGNNKVDESKESWLEIQKISQQFNSMMKQNEDMNRTLNKRIMERTLELNKAIVDLREMTNRDALTGLHNRRYLDERMAQELNRSNRYKSALSVILFEADDFAAIKQSLGEESANEVLIEIGKCLQSSMRASDIVARVGSEKFCIALTGEAAISAYDLISKLQTMFDKIRPSNTEQNITITCDFGIFNLDIEKQFSEGLDFDSIYANADTALANAKQQSNNHVVSYVASTDNHP